MGTTPQNFETPFAKHQLRLLQQKKLQRDSAMREAERLRDNDPANELLAEEADAHADRLEEEIHEIENKLYGEPKTQF